jgi:3-carboxy-cis,cis-muconate cycloisomerase
MNPRPSFDPGFSTEEMKAIFSAESTVAAMLGFEAALAMALADAGIASRAEAEEVAAACRAGVDDPDRIADSTWEAGTPLLALREEIVAGLDPDAAQWFHHGATTQDAIDTAHMLQAKSALGVLDKGLTSIAHRLRDLTVEHRDQPHMGRTFLQEARPTTFGFRTATWLDAVVGHLEELRGRRDSLVVQLGGPVGTLGTYGEKAWQVVSSVADTLELKAPDIAWHTFRVPVVAPAQALARLAATMAKIGYDISLLTSSEIAEISVRSGGSSSMPEKQNPVDAIRAVAAAHACIGAVSMLGSGSGQELDRGIGAWHVEWLAVPLAFQTAGAAVEAIETCLRSLAVDRERMSVNAGSEAPEMPPDQIDRVLAAYDRVLG